VEMRASQAGGPTKSSRHYWAWFRPALVLLVIVAVALFLWGILDVLLIAFGAILFSVFLSWLATLVSANLHISRRWALSVAIIVIASAFTGSAWLFGSRISDQVAELTTSLPANFVKIRGVVQASGWGRLLIPEFGSSIGGIVSRITEVLSSGLGFIIDFLIVSFGGIYLAAEPELYRSGLLQLVPYNYRAEFERFLEAVYDALLQWLLGQLLAMATIGILAGFSLWALGVPSAATLGLFTAITEFMPVVGPLIGALPAVIVAFGQGPRTALYAAVIYFVIQQIESNLLIPLIQERMVSLPPALTLFAEVVFGLLFGLAGLLFATPLTVVGMVTIKMFYVGDALSKPA
jgi:predicted PurR-regulated permease PerM